MADTLTNKSISFNMPNPYQADLAKIQEQQQFAQLLQQQSMQAPERFSYKGIEARTSPLTGLAKALQGFAAEKMRIDARNEEKALGERYRADQAGDMQTLIEALKPREAQMAYPASEESFGVIPAGIAKEAKAANVLEPSVFGQDVLKTPEMRNFAFQQYLAQQKSPEKVMSQVDAKDYTPDSLRKFLATGSKDYSLLQPVRKQETITTTDENGRPIIKLVDVYNPAQQTFNKPLSGFLGDLQAIGLLNSSNMQNPKVQQLISGYLGKESGQITEKEAADLRIKLANLNNESRRVAFETPYGGAAAPNIGDAFNLFSQKPPTSLVQPKGAAFGAAPQPASAAPSTSINVTQPASGPSANARILQSPRMMADALKNAPERENTLRDEFNSLTKDFRTVQDAHTKIRNVANTGAGDMSLLYSYVKLLDPGSVVRESEFATAAASGSFGERVQGAMQRVISGQRLPPDLRNDFLREADNLYKSQQEGAKRIQQNYTDIATRMNLNPRNVITDYTSPAGTALPPTSALKEGHQTAFANGQVWILKNGKPVQVK